MTSQEKKAVLVVIAFLAFLAITVMVQIRIRQVIHLGTYRCVKTYTVTTGGGDSIGTSKRVDLAPESGDVQTMRCDDDFVLGQFNSATIYGQFEPGKWYRITARGPRNPLFSMFPNVTEVAEVPHK